MKSNVDKIEGNGHSKRGMTTDSNGHECLFKKLQVCQKKCKESFPSEKCSFIDETIFLFNRKKVRLARVFAALAGAPIYLNNFQLGLEWSIDHIRQELGADYGELFLVGEKDELLLSACAGVGQDIFLQKNRFQSGQGFPGKAFFENRILVSNQIVKERKFLRKKAVSASGVQTFASVPIPGHKGVPIGCLDLAWRREDIHRENLNRILMLIVQPLGNLISGSFWKLREQIAQELDSANKTEKPGPFQFALKAFLQSSGAQTGHLVMWDSRTETVLENISMGGASPKCVSLKAAERSQRMPACPVGTGRAHQGVTKQCFVGCEEISLDGSGACCISFQVGENTKGVTVLGFDKKSIKHPIHALAALQVAAHETALRLKDRHETPQPVPPRLEIRCFGHFEVRINGNVLPSKAFSRRRALLLLKILVLNAGRPIHRNRLIDLLWPTEEAEEARLNRLYGVIHALRHAIEPNSEKENCIYILSEGENYLFNPRADVYVDLHQFRELARSAEQFSKNNKDIIKMIQNLIAATELCRGGLFEDDPYAEWCSGERAVAQDQLISILAKLSEAYLSQDDLPQALNFTRKALKADPLREDLHQTMIAIYLKMGRVKEAYSQSLECLRLFKEDIGAEPSAEFIRTHRALETKFVQN